MTGRLSKPIAILSAAAVFLALLMFAPSEITRSTGFEVIAGAEGTAHTHAPCGKESCGYDDHASVTYKPFSDAVFECGFEGEYKGFEEGKTSLNLLEYESVSLGIGDYYLDNDYTINTQSSICFDGNICLNGHTLTITTTNGNPAIRTIDITICDCSESNSGSLDNDLDADDDILIDKPDANEGSYNEVVIHLFGGKYYGEVWCGYLYVYDGADIASAYAFNANVYGGSVSQLSQIRYGCCNLYQYSGKVDWPITSNINRHYDDNHDGKCECGYYLCNESFWTISKPVNGKAIVKAGDTAEIGGFNSGLNSDWEAYYHISPTYQWYSCDKNGENKTAIAGATGDKYNAPAAETAGESYYVCGVSFDEVEEYSEVITVQTVLNPKRYDVTDGTAVDKIREALLDRSDYIELTLTGSALAGITTDNYGAKVKELYNEAFKHITCGETGSDSRLGDYIAKSIGKTDMSMVCYTSDGTTVSKVVYTYMPEYYTDYSQEVVVGSKLEEIYPTLNLSELSEQEKVYKIYNWIVTNVSYDYDGLEAGTSKTMYTAYGALVDKKAVCQGFAALFYRMCLDNGIDCRIVTGTSKGENHAWNIVKVGEKYYYADSTWDCRVTAEDVTESRAAKPGTFFYFLRGTLANHDESEEENVTSAYTGSMAAADAYLSAFKAAVVDGTATAVHLDGTALSDAEKTWYDVSVTNGDDCKKNVAVKGKSTIVSDNGLAGMKLYSGETEVHSYTNGKCTCGAFEDGIGAKLAGYTLSLNGNIGVNFYMELSSEIVNSDTAYMQFKLPNGEVTTVKVAKATPTAIGTKTYYVFPCEVAAKEMTDTITAQMFDGSGNPGTEYTYTVREYADYILEHPSEFANSEKTVALVKAMLNYGAYSQTYFGYHTERLANKDIDLALPTIEAANLVDKAPKITNNANVATFISAYLSLKSETAANVKVQVTGTPTVTVNGSSVTLSDCANSGDYYVLTVDNIPANQLDEMYVFTLTSSENTASLEFGALSYCYMALNNPSASDNLKNLCKSIYAYNTAADAYAA